MLSKTTLLLTTGKSWQAVWHVNTSLLPKKFDNWKADDTNPWTCWTAGQWPSSSKGSVVVYLQGILVVEQDKTGSPVPPGLGQTNPPLKPNSSGPYPMPIHKVLECTPLLYEPIMIYFSGSELWTNWTEGNKAHTTKAILFYQ